MNKRSYKGFGFYALLVIVVIVVWLTMDAREDASNAYTMTQFQTALDEGKVVFIEIEQNREIPTGILNIRLKDDQMRELYVSDVNEIQDLLEQKQFYHYYLSDVPPESWILNLLPLLIVLATMFILFMIMSNQAAAGGNGNMRMMNFGKSRAKLTTNENTMNFGNVAGLREEKEELEELVDFLKAPRKYIRLGARIPKGILLVGPPGTGKTLLAKAVAGEAGVPFFSISGSDFVEMFVGVGASRVRDLFEEAKRNAPCIVFIDEIDAVARRRGTGMGGGHDEREQTLNQMLVEMDGFGANEGIIVMAATNRVDILDPAIMRPGRFDRKIHVGRPDIGGREEILKVHADNKPLSEDVDLKQIAQTTAGFTGADLENLLNEAAINAAKEDRAYITQSDIRGSFVKVGIGAEKKSRIISEKEKKIVSYHEIGHAMVTALQKNTEPVQKITIVPRTMGALGYTLQTPEEEKFVYKKEELLAKITTFMAGRAAEEIKFHSVTSGAANDIEQATNIAKSMITRFGMSDKFGMMSLVTMESKYLDGRASMNCAEKTAAQVDKEIHKVIDGCYAKAVKLLTDNREVLDQISGYLYEHETITGKEFMKMFCELKGIPLPKEQKKGGHIDVTADDE